MTHTWTELDPTLAALEQLLCDAEPRSRGPQQAEARPRLSAHRAGGGWMLRVDLPGVPPRGIAVKVVDGALHIDARRRRSAPDGAHRVRCERADWIFAHRLELPAVVDTAGITARFHHGRLRIQLPRRARGNRDIPVETT